MDAVDVLSSLNEHIMAIFSIQNDVDNPRLSKELLQLYKDRIQNYTPDSWKKVLRVFPFWIDKTARWRNKKIALENFAIALYDAWNAENKLPEKELRQLASLFKGHLDYYTPNSAVIETEKGNRLNIVLSEDDILEEEKYFSFFPQDVNFMIEHPRMQAEALMKKNIIK